MPNRILREGINSSPRVDSLSDGAEILFRRLISVVDDYGRFYASPGTIRGACWPIRPERVDESRVAAWLAECARAGLLVMYEVNAVKFLQLSDFRQQVRSKSKFPEPVINCVADAEQTHITSRSRISETESKAESDAARADAPTTKPEKQSTEWEHESLVEAAWDRRRNYSRTESYDHVIRILIHKSATIDWGRFRDRHERWCAYWSKKGWNTFGSLTLLGWIEAKMPEPPSEPHPERKNPYFIKRPD